MRPRTQHTGHVETLLHRHRARTGIVAAGVSHHDGQVFQVGSLLRHGFHGIITCVDEGRPQEQVLGRIAADRQLWRQQQACPLGMGFMGGVDDLAGIARHVAHHEVELGNTNVERHGNKGNGSGG